MQHPPPRRSIRRDAVTLRSGNAVKPANSQSRRVVLRLPKPIKPLWTAGSAMFGLWCDYDRFAFLRCRSPKGLSAVPLTAASIDFHDPFGGSSPAASGRPATLTARPGFGL